MIGKIRTYFGSIKKEMGKVSWLNRQEMTGSTIVVFSFCIIMALVVFGIDVAIFWIKGLF